MREVKDVPRLSLHRLLWRVILAFLGFALLFYVLDFAWYEIRVVSPKLGPANGSVHRVRVLAIAEKNNKSNTRSTPTAQRKMFRALIPFFLTRAIGPAGTSFATPTTRSPCSFHSNCSHEWTNSS